LASADITVKIVVPTCGRRLGKVGVVKFSGELIKKG
jgi:hypothetical protein